MSSENRQHTETPRDPVFIGAEAAMHRAAKRARQLAAETARNATGKGRIAERPGELKTANLVPDPRSVGFSQAQGYEEMAGVLKLEELPITARTRIWNVLFRYIDRDRKYHPEYSYLDGDWAEVMRDLHADYHGRPLEKWKSYFDRNSDDLQKQIMQDRFNRVFDLITYVMRHDRIPNGFVEDMQREFEKASLAYTIVDGPPTIVPATTKEQGEAIVDSIKTLRQAGLNAGASHLRGASEYINQRDWAGSVRESIHAIESVARQISPDGPKGPKKLRTALVSIEKQGGLHPALKEAFNNLYGYTSDKQGIRHALLDRDDADVGIDEAVFMLGACASFASYLSRKQAALNQSGERNGDPAG